MNGDPNSSGPRAGLSALPLRIGAHGSFKAAMEAAIAGNLPALTTRDDSDPAIALMDAWAAVLDVLAFYQERIGNEAYLGTATERRSVRELVRAIGYELGPGVAAETSLAFTVQDSRGTPVVAANAKVMAAPPAALIEAGTKVQSVPGPGETAQMFETVEAIEARVEWNALKPLRFTAQQFGPSLTQLYFTGIATGLQRGDPLLLVGDERLYHPNSENWDLRRVAEIETNSGENWTRVTLDKPPGWSRLVGGVWKQVAPATRNVKVYAFRQRAALFGANAPDWLAMPNDTVKAGYLAKVVGDAVARSHCGVTANWSPWGAGALLFVNTAAAGFAQTPGYFTTLVGEAEHSLAAGVSSIYDATEKGFVMEFPSDSLPVSPGYTSQLHWTLQWMGVEAGPHSGSTVKGATDWQRDGDTWCVDVDTKSAGFRTPLYFTSMGGDAQWGASGITSIQNVSNQGFRVYVRQKGVWPNELRWQIHWFGVELGMRCGLSAPGAWRALSDGSGIYVDVDTSAAGFEATPFYFTSLLVQSSAPAFVRGVNAVYSPTATSFRVCLHPTGGETLTSALAEQHGWRIQWVGIEPNAFRDDWPAPLFRIRTADQCQIDLDAAYPKVLPGSWLALTQPPTAEPYVELYQVKSADTGSRRDFAMSAKTTHVKLDGNQNLARFGLRETTVLAQSEALEVAGAPIPGPLPQNGIALDGPADGLTPGRRLAVSGKRMRRGAGAWTPALPADEVVSEVVRLKEVGGYGEGNGVLFLEKPLQNSFDPATVSICANVARATHGETRQQALGSADASQAFQQFALKQGPLTYVSSQEPGGTSTLQVKVNDIVWDEAPTLYGCAPTDRVYSVRLNEDGTAVVEFGDGLTGARPPSGSQNVMATYRAGSGKAGNLKAGQLSLLMTRPLGVQEAINPVAAEGGQDAEEMADAKRNAPAQTLLFDRIVSLGDYADYARGFGGIGKAYADWIWRFDREKSVVRISVSGPDGGAVSYVTKENLKASIRARSFSGQPVELVEVGPSRFPVAANLYFDSHYDGAKIVAEATQALGAAFSFQSREFGQDLYPSGIESVLQSVEGVLGVDLDSPSSLKPGFSDTGQPNLWIIDTSAIALKPITEAG